MRDPRYGIFIREMLVFSVESSAAWLMATQGMRMSVRKQLKLVFILKAMQTSYTSTPVGYFPVAFGDLLTPVPIFADGFESGHVNAWSASAP